MHSFVCHKLLLSFFSLLVHITFCSHLWNALSEVSYTALKMSLWGISNQWCLCWAAFHKQNQGDCCSTANPLQLWPFRSKPYCRSEAALPFYPLRFGFSTLPPPPSSLSSLFYFFLLCHCSSMWRWADACVVRGSTPRAQHYGKCANLFLSNVKVYSCFNEFNWHCGSKLHTF